MIAPDFDRVKEVFEQWALYDAVVRHDYMLHRELEAALAEWAEAFGRPLRIVDLGCGDAGLATSGFRNASVEHYLGIDLSESSLERARNNVQIWPGRADTLGGNLADTLRSLPDGAANCVLASYSLHHFSTDEKLALVDQVARVLEPKGAFIWIDVFREDGESRDAYLSRQTRSIENDWIGLTAEQRRRIVEHVRSSDFPETKSWTFAHVDEAGFRPAATLLEDEFYDGWVFNRA